MRRQSFFPGLLLAAFFLVPRSASAQGAGANPAPAQTSSPNPPPAPKLVPPEPLQALTATYPAEVSGAAAVEADVVLELTVAGDGSVKDAKVIRGDSPFAEAAVSAATTWRFKPALRDNKPVSARIRILVHFSPPVPEAPQEPEKPAGGTKDGANGKGQTGASGTSAGMKPPAAIEVVALGERKAVGTSSLGRAEVRVLPGAFGDPFRAIESLPGVTPILSGLPFFYIRGAPPGNVGYFLDNVRVPYLYHLALGPSVVNPAIVERVDLYPGGYPAQFGRFAGGIVAGETTKPKPELHGEGNIRLFDAGALAEAPIGDIGYALVGGRFSYTAAVLSLFAPDTSLRYWDYQARTSYDITPTQHVTLFAFGASDYLGQKDEKGVEQALFDTQFHRIDLRYDVDVSPRTRLRQALTFGYDRSGIAGQDGFVSRDFLFGARSQILHRVNESLLVRGGVDAQLDSYDLYAEGDKDLQTFLDAAFPPRQDIAVGFYADAVYDAGRGVELTPGGRVDLWGSGGVTDITADVRLAMKVPVIKSIRLVSAMGLAHQPPGFVLPVPGLSIGRLAGGLQTSAQSSVGLDADLPFGFKATTTFFLNGFFNMADALGTVQTDGSGGPPGPGVDGPQPGGLNTRALGTAVGLEVYVRRKLTEKLGGYVSYTLSRSSRSLSSSSGPARFDRTHVLNGALSWEVGRGWRLGSRLVFYTGLPVEPATAKIWGKDRLDPFFRIDARIEKQWKIGKRGSLSFVVEWLNATLSEEPTGVSCDEQGTCTQTMIGPVTVPSIGVEGSF